MTTAERGKWFYHVAYQYKTTVGYAFGDTTLWVQRRITDDETVALVREELVRLADRDNAMRVGLPVIMSISLLDSPEAAA